MKRIIQIVVTKRGPWTFDLLTFDSKCCVSSETVSEKQLLSKFKAQIKRLKRVK